MRSAVNRHESFGLLARMLPPAAATIASRRDRGSLARDTPSEPCQYVGDIGQAVTRGGGTGPNMYRSPAQTINHGEAVLVADVVADEHRYAAAERGLREKGGNRPTFPTGLDQQLDHHLPVDRFERAAAGEGGVPNDIAARRRERGRLTVMER